MNMIQFASIVLLVGLVILPTAIVSFINGKQESEPEFEYDYR